MRLSLLPRLFLTGIAASHGPGSGRRERVRAVRSPARDAGVMAQRSGEYGIAAIDLSDGSTAVVNGHIAFPMASTVKLAIAAAYLTDVDRGRRSLNDMIAGRPPPRCWRR